MDREDFIFTIGYQGLSAIVDADAKKKYGKLSTMELAKKGLFRAAFCSALYSSNDADMNEFLDYFNSQGDQRQYTTESAKRLFGVYQMPQDIQKATQIK